MNTIQSEIISNFKTDPGNTVQIEHAFTKGEIRSQIFDRFNQPNSYLLLPEISDSVAIKRLIVLVPAASFSASEFSSKLRLFLLENSTILFISIITDQEQELLARRQLLFLEQMSRSSKIKVHTKLVPQESWVKEIECITQPGDLILCSENHFERQSIRNPVSVGREISSKLHLPVLVLQNIDFIRQTPTKKKGRELIAWIVFFLVISFFTFFQFQIYQYITGWIGTMFFSVTVIIEFYLIWKINKIFS
ncbi:MAG: hypothetical protein CVU39_08630 [Chloroflexi bacterium HGW-Chloroflexi-10]|nr:MAG: hypothetical protein CVU39_08630 [Chloroflexi bacterium HGW-Chloroflexi-10]